jgi:predicted alpha/beta-hydrolase family hydrolase
MVNPWRVAVDAEETTALFEPAASGGGRALFVCAHGAGGRMDDRGMAKLAEVFRARGFDIVRFNFLYREKRSSRPDPMPILKKCMAAVVARARMELNPRALVIGGRSMGGRAASMLAADGFGCDGLLLLAYPLHPAGKPEHLRDAHLPKIEVPVLCFNGTRDALCRRDLMEQALANVRAPWRMHWLEGADHSFRVLKSSGRIDAQVLEEIGEASGRWLAGTVSAG